MRTLLMAAVLTVVGVQGSLAQQASEPATYRLTGTRLAIGQDVRIERDEEVSDAVVVIGGSATIDGRVRDGVVVVGGDAHLTATADVSGDIVLVGGQLVRDEGARQVGRVNYVSFGRWSAREGRWFPSFNMSEVGRWFLLAGTTARIAVLAVLMGLMLLVARTPVARVSRAAAAEPLRAALVGLAAEIFFVPVLIAMCLALAVTIVGLAFIPLFVPLALAVALFALVLGYTALACRVGQWIEDRLGWRPGSAFLATALGLLVIAGPTFLARVLAVSPGPLRTVAFGALIIGLALEFLVWTIGLGAAILTGLGRWQTVPPPVPAEA